MTELASDLELATALRSAPWVERGQYPTPAELDTWYLEQTPAVRQAYAARMLATAQEAHRCHAADHAAYPRELEHTHRALVDEIVRAHRYRKAWHSARRRATLANEATDAALGIIDNAPIGLIPNEDTTP